MLRSIPQKKQRETPKSITSFSAMSFEIKTYRFQKPPVEKYSTSRLDEHIMGSNWPVVYLLHGNREIYVGETSNAVGRIDQHLDPNGPYFKEKRHYLDTVEIVFDTTFNKSAILDIENSLIIPCATYLTIFYRTCQ